MALDFLPRFMAITGDEEEFLQYVNPDEVAALAALTPLAKIELQEAKINPFHVHLRFCHTNKYWARGADGWIVADADQPNEDISSPSCTLFDPLILTKDKFILGHLQSGNDSVLRLKKPGNRLYVSVGEPPNQGSSVLYYKDWASFVKTDEDQGVVERKICNVRYQMEYSRIFDQEPFVAGTAIVDNDSDVQVSVGVVVTFDDETSYSFARSLTAATSTGVTTTIEAEVVGIINGEGEIGASFEANGLFEWGDTTTTTQSVDVRGEVSVPGRSRAVVECVGTKGSCNVPFHYTQQDKISSGQVQEKEEVDGIFSGSNSYNLSFQILEIEPIL